MIRAIRHLTKRIVLHEMVLCPYPVSLREGLFVLHKFGVGQRFFELPPGGPGLPSPIRVNLVDPPYPRKVKKRALRLKIG